MISPYAATLCKGRAFLAYVGILAACVASMTTSAFADAVQDCQQDKDLKLQVQGCTELLQRALTPAGQAQVYRLRGSAYLGQRKYDSAIADLTQSITIQPDAFTYAMRGGSYTAKQLYDRAIADFNAAVQLKPEVAELYLYRGNARLAKGDTANSIADFKIVIEKKPALPDGYYMRARANEALNRNDAAIADLTKLMDVNPKWKPSALFYRALANEAKGQYDLAEADFKSAIALQKSLGMERRWVEYLKSIQAEGDYSNWLGGPYDLYLRMSGL